MSTLTAVADAVVDALNAATFDVPFVAERAYIPVHKLVDLADVKVTVVAPGVSIRQLSRRVDDYDYTVEVGVYARIEPTNEAADPMVALVEQIVDLIRSAPLAGCPAASYSGVSIVPYDPAMLYADGVFASACSFTFRVARDRT